jgi:beta-1,4-mannosyl-glycoprotein beta-1,4-N-acetylglucosaminyltransferase
MIYDCFQFMNELDLLELRLRYLYPIVDRFVLVESRYTHSGLKKPLVFQENRERFAKYTNKIISVESEFEVKPERLAQDWSQRDDIVKGLQFVSDDDYVMISDLDEIPSRSAIFLEQEGFYEQDLFYFWMNTQHFHKDVGPVPWFPEEAKWIGTAGFRWSTIKSRFGGSPNAVRNERVPHHQQRKSCITSGGWHFSYLGGPTQVDYKLSAFAHGEMDNDSYRSMLLMLMERAKRNHNTVRKWKLNDPRYQDLMEAVDGEMVRRYFLP